MIKITSIEIDGFINPSKKVKLDFLESNVICIYGNNGAGKTTFLEILFAVFAKEDEKLKRYNVNKIKIDYLFKDNCETVDIGLDEDEYGNEYYNFESLDDSYFSHVSSLFLGIGRGIDKRALEIPKEMIWHFFRKNKIISENKILTGSEIDELTNKLIDWLMPKKSSNKTEMYKAKELDEIKNLYLPSIEVDIVEAFLNSKYKKAVLDSKVKIEKVLAKTSLDFLDLEYQKPDFISPDLKQLREKLLYNKSLLLEMFPKSESMGINSIFDKLKDEHYLNTIGVSQQIILSNMMKELEYEVQLFKEIKLFIDEFNTFLNYDKKLIINNNGVYIAPENHPLNKLSSGERHLLTFLATILLMGEEQDFILLDEPEISLDIEWQEKLLSTISKLAPDSQIIVASHSPSIMGDYFDESVEITLCE